ncbi:phosphatase PAP2 family protein [Nitrolancea hollandica]|uniref:Inositolphosphotransferase Aur1/Ipt1 domain-containing protein n=1 Tax=Nitrolancea hollandica Lb TaxID=1129897 RepID=I4EKR7_9BACT|nr:phosphatase PAP2 family protein [Nitrolancea hollandica]CCF85279.1 conserved membrane hypothetical protein [Nitrolancea hollandica Lb]
MAHRAERIAARSSVRRVWIALLHAVLLITAAATLTFESAQSSSSVLASAMIISITLLAMYLLQPGDRSFRIWTIYILGFILFIHLRDLADKTGNPTRFDYVIHSDQALFLGTVPTVWLQQHFATSSWLILFAAGMYASYFLAPHGVALALWRRKPQHFQRYVMAFLATCFVSLVLHFLLPTAPPWLAGKLGYLPHVMRLTDEAGRYLGPVAFQQGSAIADSNPVAAMPSLHMALTALIAVTAWQTGNHWRILGLLYAGAMLFSVVFLGEHYFTDASVGIVAALLGWKLATVWAARQSRVQEREKQLISVPSAD